MGNGVVASSTTGAAVELPLRSNWSSAVVYEDIGQHRDGVTPCFVGREQLVNELVKAMADPEQRGTYLVSGYRGAGKTTLVIEAARLAESMLQSQKAPRSLLPLVLNVSEVSASLTDANAAEPQLPISPRRLLIALLRTLDQNKLGGEVGALVAGALEQATATTYESRRGQSSSSTAERSTEKSSTFTAADAWKLLAGIAAVAAVALFGVSVWESARALTGAAAIALSGIAVVSFTTSRSSKRTATASRTDDTSIINDNSLQRIELDLQDILGKLHGTRRTIVILEELDKLDDPDGTQLASLIRYFKNLFTQVPALFLFITDKAYYDLVAARMEAARAQRTYAVEHTFFTHRLFVPRPSIADAYRFLGDVITDEHVRVDLHAIEASDDDRVRNASDMDGFEQFVRFILLKSEGHLFDLKNELSRHVRTSSAPTTTASNSVLYLADGSLSTRERAMATLQFLVESKAKAYTFGDSRGYANETLRGYLYNLVRTIGGDAELSQVDLVPGASEICYDLSNGEIGSIKDAVVSLLNDLTVGGALSRVDGAEGPPTYRWLPRAESLLRLRGVLENHEVLLANDLVDAAQLSELFGTAGSLRGVVASPEDVDARTQTWKAEEELLRQSPKAETQELTDLRRASLRDEVAMFVGPAIIAHVDRLRAIGWALSPARSDQRVWEVSPPPLGGRLFITYGLNAAEHQAMLDPRDQPTGDRAVGIVSVALSAMAANAPPAPSTTTRAGRVVTLSGNLAEAQTSGGPDGDWGRATSTELFAAEQWLSRQILTHVDHPIDGRDHEVLFIREGMTAPETVPVGLGEAVDAWLHGPERILGVMEGVNPVGFAPLSFDLSDVFARVDPSFKVVIDPANSALVTRSFEIERLASLSRLVIAEIQSAGPGLPTITDSSNARIVRDLRWVEANQANVGGVAVIIQNNVSSVTMAGVELERIRPSLGRDLLQRSAAEGDNQAIRRLLQTGIWGPADLDSRALSEPASILLYEAAIDDRVVDPPVRTRLLVAAYERGATNAFELLKQIVETSPVDADERADVGAAAYALAKATTVEATRQQWLAAAAARDHVPALLQLLRDSARDSPDGGFDHETADRLAELGQAVAVGELINRVDPAAAVRYLELGVRRDEADSMRALAQQVQANDPDRARELRNLAIEREKRPA